MDGTREGKMNESRQEKLDKIFVEEGFESNRFAFESYQMFNKYIFWIDGGSIALISAYCSSVSAGNGRWQPLNKAYLIHGIAFILISLFLMLFTLNLSGDGYTKRARSNFDYVMGNDYKKVESSSAKATLATLISTWVVYGFSLIGLIFIGLFFIRNL